MTTNNSTPIRTVKRNQKGGTLISVIGVILIIGVLGVSVITLTQSSEHSFLSANAGSRAYYLAESGLRYAQEWHCDQFADDQEGWRHGRERTLTFLGGRGEQVDIIRLVNTFWATAVTDPGTAQEARARVPMPIDLCGADPNALPSDEFAVFGETAISLGSNTVIKGDVAITGQSVELRGDVEGNILAGDISTTGSGGTTVTGNIVSSGTVRITTGSVTGDIHAATGIRLSSAQSTVFGGWLFANGNIEVGGSAEVHGHIHSCGGDVILDGSAIIGTATDPVEVRASGDVDMSGFATIYGTVYAGGNIELGNNNSIVGNAYAGGTILNAASITGTALQLSPNEVKPPICPDLTDLEDLNLPDASVFTAGGDDHSIPNGTDEMPTQYVLVPNSEGVPSYGNLSSANMASHTQLYLNAGSGGHGNYYFDSIDLGGNLTLYLNLSGTHDIRIFTVGDITFGRELSVFVSTDGTAYTDMSTLTEEEALAIAPRVYWESHADYSLGSDSNWFGTVYTPNGSLSTNNGYLIGSYFSGGGHNLQNSTVLHVGSNYFAED